MATVKTVKISPLGERVLIKPDEPPEKIGSVFIPEAAKEQPMRGIVMKVGDKSRYRFFNEDGNLDADTWPNAEQAFTGCTVLYGKYCGTEITEGGETFLLLKDADILAVIE
jgi:chaperonin GroES